MYGNPAEAVRDADALDTYPAAIRGRDVQLFVGDARGADNRYAPVPGARSSGYVWESCGAVRDADALDTYHAAIRGRDVQLFVGDARGADNRYAPVPGARVVGLCMGILRSCA